MRFRSFTSALAVLAVLGGAGEARAGMPAITLSEIARMRVEAISFFLACFLACAWVVQRIWNGLRADFPRLPHLTYGKAVGLVVLWGLLFLLVLTMISGARELLTPGAWQKEGYTYKLRADQPAPAAGAERPEDAARRGRLEQLRLLLWNYARNHDGAFPDGPDVPEIPPELWTLPDPSGMRYLYHGGQAVEQGDAPLVSEPGIFGAERLVLLTSGAIRRMTSEELRRSLMTARP